MIANTFKDIRTNETYTKIQARTAKKLFLAGERIGMIACKLNPMSTWNYPMYVAKRADKEQFVLDEIGMANYFDSMVNSFKYYNCNSVAGNYITFYHITK